jgi:hypothetical protein
MRPTCFRNSTRPGDPFKKYNRQAKAAFVNDFSSIIRTRGNYEK